MLYLYTLIMKCWKEKLRKQSNPNVHSSTIYNGQDKEATQGPMNRQMDKDCGVYV